MNYQQIFTTIHEELSSYQDVGTVASYIPELGKVDPNKFGVHLTTINDEHSHFGDSDELFSIQSIAKVFALVLAYQLENEALWARVGVEPSGTPFNSLVQLETDNGIPRNPFINAGALVLCDVLVSHFKHPKQEFLTFIRKVSGIPDLDFCTRIAESEKKQAFEMPPSSIS